MRDFKSKLSKEIQRLHDWSGPVFPHRYRAVPVSDEPAAQIARLRLPPGAGCQGRPRRLAPPMARSLGRPVAPDGPAREGPVDRPHRPLPGSPPQASGRRAGLHARRGPRARPAAVLAKPPPLQSVEPRSALSSEPSKTKPKPPEVAALFSAAGPFSASTPTPPPPARTALPGLASTPRPSASANSSPGATTPSSTPTARPPMPSAQAATARPSSRPVPFRLRSCRCLSSPDSHSPADLATQPHPAPCENAQASRRTTVSDRGEPCILGLGALPVPRPTRALQGPRSQPSCTGSGAIMIPTALTQPRRNSREVLWRSP